MSVEYFRWSSLDLRTLGNRMLTILTADHVDFEREVAAETADFEDRAITRQFRSVLSERLRSWCNHFEIPAESIQGYETIRRGWIGGQSWMADFDLMKAVDGIGHALQRSDDRLYRPKVLERATEEVMRWLRSRPDDVDRVHPRSFESIVAELLHDRGWTVELTQTTRDGGYDVLALRSDALGFTNTLVVECKLYDLRRPVGIAMVDRLMGVLSREHASAGLLVTNSRFSVDAWRAWESRIGRDLELLDRSELFDWLEHYKELPDAASG
jgi:hypothetical protein